MPLKTSEGVSFCVDDEDVPQVSAYRWRLNSSGYVSTTMLRKRVTLHRFLLGPAPSGLEWDHIDRDKTNNRRSNFRAVLPLRNTLNRDAMDRFSNVTWNKSTNRWHVRVSVMGRCVSYGCYEDLDIAQQWAYAARVMAQRERESFELLEINRLATLRLRRMPVM